VPPTAIHRMLERCRAGDYPAVVSRLRSGWLVMGERQVFPGYCLLLPDPVVAHLNALQPAAQAQFLSDMASSGDAMLASTGATRINYAIFGNVDPALHAHLFPRHSTEPSSSRSLHPWALDWIWRLSIPSSARRAEAPDSGRDRSARVGRLRRVSGLRVLILLQPNHRGANAFVAARVIVVHELFEFTGLILRARCQGGSFHTQ